MAKVRKPPEVEVHTCSLYNCETGKIVFFFKLTRAQFIAKIREFVNKGYVHMLYNWSTDLDYLSSSHREEGVEY